MCVFSHVVVMFLIFFFFKQKTAYEMRISDWSSDVCSSDLIGPTTNEVTRIREAGDHSDRRAVAPASQAHAGAVGHPAPDLLTLVRPLPRARAGGAGGSAIGPEAGVEPHLR